GMGQKYRKRKAARRERLARKKAESYAAVNGRLPRKKYKAGERPPTIFKYESYSVRSIENLKSQVVYFAPPRIFNDPYDCRISVQVAEPTMAECERLKAYFLNDDQMPAEVKAQVVDSNSQRLLELIWPSLDAQFKRATTDFISNAGITC